MLSDDFKILLDSINKGFYSRLISGEIRKAKDTLNFIILSSKNIIENWANEKEDFENIDISDTQKLDEIIKIVVQKFTDLYNNASSQLFGLEDEEFRKDSETYKELLEREFKPKVKEISDLISAANLLFEKLNKERKRQSLPPFVYLKKYLEKKEKFDAKEQEIIDFTERKILFFLSRNIFNHKITGVINTGKWKNHRHAWLSGTLGDYRIVYSWENGRVIFETIGTHKEIGIN